MTMTCKRNSVKSTKDLKISVYWQNQVDSKSGKSFLKSAVYRGHITLKLKVIIVSDNGGWNTADLSNIEHDFYRITSPFYFLR